MKRFVILAAGLAASAGLAQPPGAAPGARAPNPHDPNEVVCQRVQLLGSRLNNSRICRTRAEWDLQRRTDRMDTERAQLRRDIPH